MPRAPLCLERTARVSTIVGGFGPNQVSVRRIRTQDVRGFLLSHVGDGQKICGNLQNGWLPSSQLELILAAAKCLIIHGE